MAEESKPKHFDYEELDRWERHLRSLGFQNITVERKYQGVNVSRLHLEMTLVPWEPLPDIRRSEDNDLAEQAGRGAEARRP